MNASGPPSTSCCRGSSGRSWPARLRSTAVTCALTRRWSTQPCRFRAARCCRCRTRAVSSPFATGLVRLGFELVSTGGTARALREAGLPVTDVAAVTGFPEMLDGRIKTLHPRVHGGLLADRRLPDHRRQLIEAGIAPFELVVVNLYPFAEAAARPGIAFDALVEEIDIGGPSMVRAAAKNHANVTIVTDPARYGQVLEALQRGGGIPLGLRSALAAEAFRHTAAYDARIAAELPPRMAAAGIQLPDEPGLPGASDPYPPTITIALEKVETLRYGENPHQPAARYQRRARGADGPFASSAPPLQGKTLSYNNVLDASAADALGRALRGPGVAIVKHTNPCGAAERPTLLEAWHAALEADPVSAFGGVVALTRRRPAGRRGPRVDLPRDRHRACVRRGCARGAGDETEPARPGRPGHRGRRPIGRPSCPSGPARCHPDSRGRGARHGTGHARR